MEATKTLLQKINFPMENYYEESFGGAKKKKKQPTPTVPAGERTSIVQPPSTPATSVSVPTSVSTPAPAPAPVSAPITPPTVSPTSIVGFDTPSATPASTPAPPPAAPATAPSPAPASSSPMIVLSKSGQEISCDGEEVILDVAEAEGADLPFGCRMGACGACKVKKIEGDVVYDEDIDCEDGFVYTCVARPAGRVVIEA